ncbi:hypothetical protein M2103_002649 [Ereboglobus sp. PH5-5]|nr:hypothetical protein [Ereboglobus sp. PH5-5]
MWFKKGTFFYPPNPQPITPMRTIKPLILPQILLALLALFALAACSDKKSPAGAQTGKGIQHELVVIDEGRDTLFYINERNPSKNWLVKTGLPKARDLQLIGGGRLLVGYDNGYAEYNLADGKQLKKYDALSGVTSVRRQPDGNTIVTGVDLRGGKGVSVVVLDATDRIRTTTVYPGNYVRLMRQTAQGTYLMACGNEIREASTDGRYLKTYPVEGFKNMWKAMRLPDNRIIASAGYGAFMAELDADGNVLRKWGAKGQVPDNVNPHFAATFQLLPNGHTVLANWQGHGPDHGKSGVQLLEFDKDGKIVWQWSKADMISSLQGVLVLDGLDTSRLHDERNGVMEPL